MASQQLYKQLMEALANSETFQALPEKQRSEVTTVYSQASDDEVQSAIETLKKEPPPVIGLVEKAAELDKKVKMLQKGLLEEDFAVDRKESDEKADQMLKQLD